MSDKFLSCACLAKDQDRPQAAFADPVGIGTLMASAEEALRLERRLVLEARIQF